MAEMASMKLTPNEKKDDLAEWKPPDYPYGLELNLSEDELAKLNISDLPAVGVEVTISGKGEITRASMTQRNDGEDSKSLSIQITDLSVDIPRTDADRAGNIFNKDNSQ